MFLCFLQHDFSYFNVKTIVNLKGSDCNIWKVFEVLDCVRCDIFRDTVFGYLLDVPRLQEDGLLFHKMFIHQIRSDPSRQYENGIWAGRVLFDNRLQFWGVSKKHWEKVSEKLVTSKKRCLLRERLFPNHTNSLVEIGDLKSLILYQTFLEVDNADAVRVCLIYILCEGFLGKEINDWNLDVWNRGSYLWDFTYDDLEDTWNKINKYLSLPERRQTLKYSVSGFTGPIRIWIYEMLPTVRACGFVLRKNRDMPRMKRWSGTKKLKWVDVNKIFSKIQYVYGERKSVPPTVRDQFRRQDEFSSSMSSSGRCHGRGRGSGKHNLDEVLKRLHALEQHVFMNRQPTEVFVEEVNNEDFWKDISFEEPIVFQEKYDEQVVQDEVMNKNNTTENIFGDIEDEKELEERNDNAGNKFDDDVFDVNDYNEAKEIETFFLIREYCLLN
uniref:DUF1985 domain-containing protein n=1 Tax=Lactuca sativa TaxID=4236 RepID=A0A9R1VJQ7_LACSA|nr:hypothetical protein LSAT_V11C500242790 [Lactuca sativa]